MLVAPKIKTRIEELTPISVPIWDKNLRQRSKTRSCKICINLPNEWIASEKTKEEKESPTLPSEN